MAFEPRDPGWIQKTLQVFNAAPFVRDVGFRLVDIEPGRLVSELDLGERHLQQDGYVHAGVQATMADHTAGTAAATLMAAGRIVLTIEFKLSLMVAARGDMLICRSEVLKPGKTVTFAESKIFAVADRRETLVSHATVSLAIVER